MEKFIVVIILFLLPVAFYWFRKLLSKSKSGYQKHNSISPQINIIISDTPPPGGLLFKPDGSIEKIPDSLEARYRWTIQKMTYKIEQEPDDVEWYFERGKAHMGLHQYQEAIPDFSKLIEMYPTWGGYYELRGLCYFYAGEKAHALTDLQRYKELARQKRLDENTIKILDELEKTLMKSDAHLDDKRHF